MNKMKDQISPTENFIEEVRRNFSQTHRNPDVVGKRY